MHSHLCYPTEAAGNSRTGIRSAIAEHVASTCDVVLGLASDHQDLADELDSLNPIAKIFDITQLLRRSASSASVVRGGLIDQIELWFGRFERRECRCVFMARDSSVEIPAELIETAISIIANPWTNQLATGNIFPPLGSLTAFALLPVER